MIPAFGRRSSKQRTTYWMTILYIEEPVELISFRSPNDRAPAKHGLPAG
jgi:hypothetical protein